MTDATDTYRLLAAFADELARCGMRIACTSPGSRSAPLVLSLARSPLHCFSHVDERCAGFFALGHAKARGVPAAVACTSGTAAAELLPAAIEAREARVPLLLLTADRPAELRENGAGQAVDQIKLFGSAVKWFFEVEPVPATPAGLRWMRTLACRAYAATLEGRPGAVHLNLPLREPLVLVEEAELPRDETARAGGRPYVARVHGSVSWGRPLNRLRELLGDARRGVVVAGRDERAPALGPRAAEFAASAGWPLLADPLSGARRGAAAVAHYDAMLRDPSFAADRAPDLVLRVGDLPVSKPLRSWLTSLAGVPQVSLDPECAWQDPDAVLSASLQLAPQLAFERLSHEGSFTGPADPDWLASWRSADERAAEAIAARLAGAGLTEPGIAAELGVLLPAEATLFVASSMPVRDIETVWPVREDPPRVLSNRGANGIDGTVSSAFGAAAGASPTEPVVLLIGDVALAHDIGGLLAAGRLGLKLTIVLLENGGGGIFDFLPVSQAPMARAGTGRDADLYTEHVATPTGLDFGRAAALYGLGHERVQDVQGFRLALERALASPSSSIVEVPTARPENVALHRRLWDDVAEALSR